MDVAPLYDLRLGTPRLELWQLWQPGHLRTIAGAGAGQREVRLERPRFWLQAGGSALRLHALCQRAHGLVARAHSQPDHPHQPASPKRPDLAQGDLD